MIWIDFVNYCTFVVLFLPFSCQLIVRCRRMFIKHKSLFVCYPVGWFYNPAEGSNLEIIWTKIKVQSRLLIV